MKLDRIKTKADEKALAEGCYYDPTYPEKLEQFFLTYCKIPRGNLANKPFALLEWQRTIIYDLFGWRKANGDLRYRHCLLHSPKKIGKSLLTSFLALSQLLLAEQPAPHVVVCAPTRKQASDLYENIEFAVNANPKLKEALHLIPSQKIIEYPKKNGKLTIGSAESPNSLGGIDCTVAILDEVCLHPNSKLYDMLYYSMRARKNPLMILLSNAGWDRTHFYYNIYKNAKSILNNESEQTDFLPIVFEVPEEADWEDEKLWYEANPSLGTVFSIDEMRSDFAKAKRDKGEEILFRRWLLAQWVQRKEIYLDLGQWDRCQGAFPDLTNQPFYCGVDLSATTDLTSISAVYPIGDKIYVKSYNFVPRAALKREGQNAERYRLFHESNHLTLTEGNCVDYGQIRQQIKAIQGKCIHIAIDRWNALETSELLKKEGYNIFYFGQFESYYNEPMKKLNLLIADRKIVHDGNQCLRWALGNLQAKPNEKGLIKPIKSAEHLKIDSACALIMALQGTLTFDSNSGISTNPYENRGIHVFRKTIINN